MARSRSVDLTQVLEWQDKSVRPFQDYLAGEEPLEIRVRQSSLTVTMRTPGHDFELSAGFLFTEGLVQRGNQILSIAYAQDAKETERGNVVEVELRPDVALDLARTQRNFFAASSCGICGKASIESVRLRGVDPPNPNLRLDPELLCRLPEGLKDAQTLFERTGGLHAAALFDTEGNLIALREDVGRHNAVDKIVGWALLEGRVPLREHVLLVSGRGGFEIVQKALAAGVPVVASVSAPSGLAVRLARELRLTLVGFVRGRRFVVYAGEERLSLNAAATELRPNRT